MHLRALPRPKAGYFSLLVVAEIDSRGSFLVGAERIAAAINVHSQAGPLPTYHKYQNPTFHSSSG